jgi:FKBP-type peptidyl-prolyl cis-trans isomerase FkpA
MFMMKKNSNAIFSVLIAGFLITLVSCDPSKKYQKQEEESIQGYIDQNPGLNFELKPSGLYYSEVLAGTGIMPVIHDTVYVKYTGSFLDGTVFDSNILDNNTDTLIFPLNEGWYIAGFEEGINYMKVGGKATFLIPSKLGFGAAGNYPYIKGYEPLLFEVRLVKVKQGPGE